MTRPHTAWHIRFRPIYIYIYIYRPTLISPMIRLIRPIIFFSLVQSPIHPISLGHGTCFQWIHLRWIPMISRVYPMMVGFIPSILPLSLLYPIEPPFPISPRPKSLRKEADPKKVKFDEAGVLQDAPSSELCLWLYHCNIATSQDIGKMMKNGAMINFSILWGFDLEIFATQPRATTVTSYNLSTYDWNSRDLWKGKGYICVWLFSSKMAKLTSESRATLFCDVL